MIAYDNIRKITTGEGGSYITVFLVRLLLFQKIL